MADSGNSCAQWNHQPRACFILDAISRSFFGLSTLGSFLVIVFLIVTQKYKVFVQKLVLALAINTFIYSVALTTTSSDSSHESKKCLAYAILHQYFTLTLLLWIFVITLHISMRVYNFKNVFSQYFWAVCPLVLLLPLVPTSLPLVNDYYGPAGIWCWIKKGHNTLRFGTFYIPIFVFGTIEIVLYVLIVLKVYKITKPLPRDDSHANLNNARYRDEVKPILLFPVIYLCLYIPITIYRVDEALNPSRIPSFPLAVVSAICASSNGLINSVVYLTLVADRKELSFRRLVHSARVCCQLDDAFVEHNIEVYSRTRHQTETEVE